jgi:hypothetical protein
VHEHIGRNSGVQYFRNYIGPAYSVLIGDCELATETNASTGVGWLHVIGELLCITSNILSAPLLPLFLSSSFFQQIL